MKTERKYPAEAYGILADYESADLVERIGVPRPDLTGATREVIEDAYLDACALYETYKMATAIVDAAVRVGAIRREYL